MLKVTFCFVLLMHIFSALETLKKRFGSDFVVANAFRQKLRKWPRIQNDDFVGFRKFSDYVAQVETAKECNRSLSVLDDEQENRALLFKIPDFVIKVGLNKPLRLELNVGPILIFRNFVNVSVISLKLLMAL